VPSYSIVQSSRALHIFNEIKKEFSDTYLIMQSSNENEFELDNLIQVKPFVDLKGKFILLKGMIFRLQLTLFTFKFAITNKIDFVILRGYDCIFLLILLKIIGVRVYYDFHGRYNLELTQQGRFLRSFFVKNIDKIILKYSDKLIVVSEGIKNQISKYEKKCIILPNGVDLDRIKNANNECLIELPADKKIIGFIGNWESFMKIDDICESLNYLSNCTGLIIGLGYNAKFFVDKYKGMNIIFTGRISQEKVYTLLNKMDICIIPYDQNDSHSRNSDFFSSRKAKEYIAAGKPIIVADVIGKEGWLVEYKNCLLYESGNSKDLADKITELLNTDDLYKTMSENNKRLAEQFTWGNLMKHSGLIEEIMNYDT